MSESMYYMLNQSSGGEDDGSAWELRAGAEGNVRAQVGPLCVDLLKDGLRAFDVGGEILVDQQLAIEIETISPGYPHRSANVVGPQPARELRAPMIQLLAQAEVWLAKESIVHGDDGRLSLRQPYVLNPARPASASICKIHENGVTIVNRQMRDLLASREPTLFFAPVRFEDEQLPHEEPEPPPFRMPSKEELMGMKRS